MIPSDWTVLHPEIEDVTVFVIGEEDLEGAENLSCRIVFVPVKDWNRELSPFAYYGKGKYDRFDGEADQTLEQLKEIIPAFQGKTRYIAGYSLAGLFSLYALYETDLFDGAASVSGSLWFPGWEEYRKNAHLSKPAHVYLSLGDREERSRNPLWALVGVRTKDEEKYLLEDPMIRETVYEMNEGGHFDHPSRRLLRGLTWLLKQKRR
ncbi:MAG: hypothetical protein IIU06_01580 [Erysipelotrichales bacterium]|nr:hypothetical protein [Erysipelotrichales bacterium]